MKTCDAEIMGRDGKPMPFRCNLDAGHLGKCALTTRDEPVEAPKP